MEAERTRGRLESQVKESGAIEQRIAQAEKESQELGVRLDALDEEIAGHQQDVDDARSADRAGARAACWKSTSSARRCRPRCASARRPSKPGRQVILRLLGEASTLKNQLAQIEEYLAGIERETARSTREEQVAAAEIERLEARPQAALRNPGAAPAGAGIGDRRAPPHRRGTGRPPAQQPPNCAARSTALKNEVSQIRARKESLEQVLAHRTYTTESVKRLFAALEKGKAAGPEAARACWPTSWKWIRSSKSRPKSSCTKSWNTWWWRTGSRPSAGWISSAPNWTAAPPSWCIPEPNGNGHGHLPEPAIGPETGIAARLSDSLRLTNGFKDRAVDLLPRVSLCFLAEDRAAAQRLAVSYPHLYFLLPDGVCYHGHTVTGGKKTGAGPLAMKREARELAVDTAERGRTRSTSRWRGWTA